MVYLGNPTHSSLFGRFNQTGSCAGWLVLGLFSACALKGGDEIESDSMVSVEPPGSCAPLAPRSVDAPSVSDPIDYGDVYIDFTRDHSRLEKEILGRSPSEDRREAISASAPHKPTTSPDKRLRVPLQPCIDEEPLLPSEFVSSSAVSASAVRLAAPSSLVCENSRPANKLATGGAKFCSECGTKLPSITAKFCPECGTATRRPVEAAAGAPVPRTEAVASRPTAGPASQPGSTARFQTISSAPAALDAQTTAAILKAEKYPQPSAASASAPAAPPAPSASSLRAPSSGAPVGPSGVTGQGPAVKYSINHLWSAKEHQGGVMGQRNGAGIRAAKKREEEKAGMVDKRKARMMNRESFAKAICEHRHGTEAEAAHPPQPPSCGRGASNVLAYVRKRPLLAHELTRGEFDALSVDESTARVTTHSCLMRPDLVRMYIRHASFAASGATFDEACDEQHVYEASAEPLAAHALAGGRSTLFLYGQTGSGKTHTMHALLARLGPQLLGSDSSATLLALTAIEVMGKRCFDLATGNECKVHQRAGGAIELAGAGHQQLRDAEELEEAFAAALERRATEATGANSSSSRSHAIIVIDVLTDAPERGVRRGGRLTLVDCAGSEWSADSAAHCASRRREGAEINSSLHALKQCVRAYGERARTGRTHIPFRDSLLTRLLASSFDGSCCRLAVFGCVSPGAADTEHTMSTLRTVMELSDRRSEPCAVTQTPVKRVGKYTPQATPML